MNDSKKIISSLMACFCVLSSQTLVQYGLLKREGGIIAKNSSSLQVFGDSENALQNKNELDDNNICNGCKYTLNDGKATLTECMDGNITELEIPEFVEKNGKQYSVTKIDKNAFYYFTNLESVVIAESVTRICEEAFCYCRGLKIITLPKNLTSIGKWAFGYCSKLNSITLSENLTSIGKGAFCGCENLENITIPENVESIGKGCFNFCHSLKTINVSKNNQNYESKEGVLFSKGCTQLIHYPAGKMKDNYSIPESVTKICENAFCYCGTLQSVNISEGVKIIDNAAFVGCKSLESIIIPNSVTLIRDDAFNICYSLKTINVGENNPNYKSIEGILFSKDCQTLIMYPAGKIEEKYNIFATVISIGNWAFSDCQKLKIVNLSENITSIGEMAFCGCKKLEKLNIPAGVESIEEGTFQNCESLESITIPNSVTSIGKSAFYNCRELNTIALSEKLTSIGDWAFEHCEKLEKINIPKNAPCKAILERMGLSNKIFEVDSNEGKTSINN